MRPMDLELIIHLLHDKITTTYQENAELVKTHDEVHV